MSDAISVRSGSLVTVTARALADLSMAAQDGDSLGSEDELLAWLRVSRPTLRQAAKMVESDRLIAVRRGAKGGFYACRPNAADVIRAPARYLRLNGATIADVHAVTTVIAEMTAAAAARSEDVVLREQLAAFRDSIEANDTVGDIIRAESDLTRLLTEMSGNPVARLFLEISHTFGRNEHHLRFYQSDEDRRRARVLQRGVCDAVLVKDPDIARLMMQRRSALIREWLVRTDKIRTSLPETGTSTARSKAT